MGGLAPAALEPKLAKTPSGVEAVEIVLGRVAQVGARFDV